MSDISTLEQVFEDLKKLASEDGDLLDVIDFVNKTSDAGDTPSEPKLLMPYVNAPMICAHAWK